MKTFLCITFALLALGCGNQAAGTPQAEMNAPTGALTGTVLETFDSGGYTYLRLDTASGETWAAVTQTPMEVGKQVAITGGMEMRDFQSPSLGRTFETIYFGSLVGEPGAVTNPHAGATPPAGMGMGMGQSASTASLGPIDVERVGGERGRTVAELFEQRSELSGQSVTVRGQVVKFNAQIMGRNWLHLQDGSGDAATGDHDITVTTMDTASVGDVVLVEGTVVLDKDFGAGYSYALLLEEATIQQ